MSVLFIFII